MVNPSCGDKVTVSLTKDDRLITAMAVKVRGCAICEASAGLIHHFADIESTGMNSAAFMQMVTDIPEWFADPENHHLPHAACAPLMPVKLSYRNRIRCATLPFEAYTLAYDSPI
jgi:nitrogen fixation NifU-like protein